MVEKKESKFESIKLPKDLIREVKDYVKSTGQTISGFSAVTLRTELTRLKKNTK